MTNTSLTPAALRTLADAIDAGDTVTIPRAAATSLINLAEGVATLATSISDTLRQTLHTTPASLAGGTFTGADVLPMFDTPQPAAPVRTAADVAAYREAVYAHVHSTGISGITTPEVVATTAPSTTSRAKKALRALEAAGLVFNTGIGLKRWYATAFLREVRSAMRRRLPDLDPTVAEAAHALATSEQHIRELITTGELPGRLIGRSYVVSRKAVLARINQLGTPTTSTD